MDKDVLQGFMDEMGKNAALMQNVGNALLRGKRIAQVASAKAGRAIAGSAPGKAVSEYVKKNPLKSVAGAGVAGIAGMYGANKMMNGDNR